MSEITHPIDNIKWMHVDQFDPNDYNPNVVYDRELKLLAFSIKKQGWIQPILAGTDRGAKSMTYPIIDGYHRWWLTKNDKDLRALTGGRVPCALLDITQIERMLLTIRINRAKGVHIAI